jgi:type I restriction enzyme R subunit
VLLFINGLPLVVIELKSPSSEQATLQTAYTQLQTYKAEIPSLFRTNAALVISDGQLARIELPEARSLSWTRSWMS